MVPKLFSFKAYFRKNRNYSAHFEHLIAIFSHPKVKSRQYCLSSQVISILASLWQECNKSVIEIHVHDVFFATVSILGRFLERQTLISSSIQHSRSRFLDFIMWSVKNPSSHRYDVENCIKMVKAFLANKGYSSLTAIQNVSIGTSTCLILSPRSLEIHADSYSSYNRRPVLDELCERISNPVILISLQWWKKKLNFSSRLVKCWNTLGLIFFMQLSRTKGNISKLPSSALFFQISTFFLNATSLSDELTEIGRVEC